MWGGEKHYIVHKAMLKLNFWAFSPFLKFLLFYLLLLLLSPKAITVIALCYKKALYDLKSN